MIIKLLNKAISFRKMKTLNISKTYLFFVSLFYSVTTITSQTLEGASATFVELGQTATVAEGDADLTSEFLVSSDLIFDIDGTQLIFSFRNSSSIRIPVNFTFTGGNITGITSISVNAGLSTVDVSTVTASVAPTGIGFQVDATTAGAGPNITFDRVVFDIVVEGIAPNNPPTFTTFADVVESTNEDTAVEITFAELAAQGNEMDSDGTVNAFVVQAVSSGTLLINGTPFAAGTNDEITAVNSANWTPAINASGTLNAFTVTAQDDAGDESTSPVQATVTVNEVNDIPTFTAFADVVESTDEDTGVEITFAELAAQGDEGDSDGTVDTFVVQAVTTGTLLINGSAFAAGTNDEITAASSANWTPATNAAGTLNAFTVIAQDEDDGESTTPIQVTITVTEINDMPIFTAFADVVESTNEDAGVEITFAELAGQGDEADVDGTVDAFVVQAISTGTLLINGAPFAAGTNDEITAVNSANWTPATDASGTLNAFTVVAQDDDGDESITAIQATIEVTSVNDTPSFDLPASPNQTVAESTTINSQTVNGFATNISDNDGDTQALTFNVSNDNTTLFSVQPAIDSATGNLTYSVDANASGVATVTVSLSDNGGGSDTSADQTFDIIILQKPTITSISIDSGNSSTDFITQDNTPNVHGEATPGSIIHLILNGNSSALIPPSGISVTADAMGNYIFPFPVAFGSLPSTSATLAVTATLDMVSIASDDQAVTVDSEDPLFTSANAVDFVEEGTGTAYTAETMDDTSVVYAITGGEDSGEFSITSAGVVTFDATPDFENPTDDDTDNDYIIEITATDLAGNTEIETVTISVTDIDDTAPTVSITSVESPGPTGANPIPITVTFDENVTGFEATDIVVTNGSVVDFTGADDSYSFNIDPTAPGAITVNIASAVAQDLAANDNEAASEFSIVYDPLVLSIAENEISESSFSFENPVGNVLEIKSTFTISNIKVYDMEGRVVATANQNSLEVAQLPSDVYIAIVTLENGQSIALKIIKE